MYYEPFIIIVGYIPTGGQGRGETVFYGDYQLGKDRMEQIRAEVKRNRLEASLARDVRLQEAGTAHRSVFARSTTLIATLIR